MLAILQVLEAKHAVECDLCRTINATGAQDRPAGATKTRGGPLLRFRRPGAYAARSA
jgi:hypothetical protein